MTEVDSNLLQIIVNEFKNISPEIEGAFIFDASGEIIACDETTAEDQTKKLGTIFLNLSRKAEVVGGIEALIIQGANGQLNIESTNNRYLSLVSSRSVDIKVVNSLTRVIIPTLMKIMDEVAFEVPEKQMPQTIKPEVEPSEDLVESPQKSEPTDSVNEAPPVFDPPLPQPPVIQFMVEKIGGLLIPSDTVRVDSAMIEKWSELYGEAQITQIHIETLEGKTAICKFRAVKEDDLNARGIIQIPEKILQSLQTSKGKLVIVKPVINGY